MLGILILKSAYFGTCSNCGQHGEICLPNGERFPVFYKDEARQISRQLCDVQKISQEELVIILDQIETSSFFLDGEIAKSLFGNLLVGIMGVSPDHRASLQSEVNMIHSALEDTHSTHLT